MIIAVDFDETLKIDGEPNTALFARLINAQRGGAILILWTCRAGDSLREAVQYCAERGLGSTVSMTTARTPSANSGTTREKYLLMFI